MVGSLFVPDTSIAIAAPSAAEAFAALTDLCHDIFVGRVTENVLRVSPLCQGVIEVPADMPPLYFSLDGAHWRPRDDS
jgi:hypothetical protein